MCTCLFCPSEPVLLAIDSSRTLQQCTCWCTPPAAQQMEFQRSCPSLCHMWAGPRPPFQKWYWSQVWSQGDSPAPPLIKFQGGSNHGTCLKNVQSLVRLCSELYSHDSLSHHLQTLKACICNIREKVCCVKQKFSEELKNRQAHYVLCTTLPTQTPL